jgi:ABC-type bacteriocin/lantibiotic exporter with double-glycine peptidase domain
MDSEPKTAQTSFLKGPASLLIAVVIAVFLLIYLRWFFLIIVGLGVVLAGGIYLWNKFNPITNKETPDDKRPLGLS